MGSCSLFLFYAAQDLESKVIRDLCGWARKPDFCFSMLSSDSRSRGQNCGEHVYHAIVESKEQGKEAKNHVLDLQKQTTDPSVTQILNYCGDEYDIGLSDMEEALVDYNKGEYRLAALSVGAFVATVVASSSKKLMVFI